MPEVTEHTTTSPRLRQKARVAGFPLWLHVRAYSTLSLMLAGAIAGAVSVVGGWKSLSSAIEFFSVWACTGLVLYWASFAWYAVRRKLGR